MTATALGPSHYRAFPRPVIVMIAVAALIGAALVGRGPEPVAPPVMADAPVILPDGRALYVQKYEVTVAEWNACHEAGACTLRLRPPPNVAAADVPATGLSYLDVGEYLGWINAGARGAFRLPTADEWAHMAAEVLPDTPDPIFADPSLTWASTYLTEGLAPRALRPKGSFSTSAAGISDLDGSVWEWTQECYAGVDEGIAPERCPAYFVGGEHVAAMSYLIRDPARGGCAVGAPPAHLGMRLVSDRPV